MLSQENLDYFAKFDIRVSAQAHPGLNQAVMRLESTRGNMMAFEFINEEDMWRQWEKHAELYFKSLEMFETLTELHQNPNLAWVFEKAFAERDFSVLTMVLFQTTGFPKDQPLPEGWKDTLVDAYQQGLFTHFLIKQKNARFDAFERYLNQKIQQSLQDTLPQASAEKGLKTGPRI